MKKNPNRTAVFFLTPNGQRFPANRAAKREINAVRRKYFPPEDRERREERLRIRASWRAQRDRYKGLINRG